MNDKVWKRDEPQSPCIKLCQIHPQARLCIGCLRTIDEISQWSRLSPDMRGQIMAELPARKPLLQKRRGGRRAKRTSPE
ncbi:DUF1289 domain-containing protein [Rhodobacteraceae bacterium]|nr:DUF1289 domain-containing protein [Paracoccaceae bacterium]